MTPVEALEVLRREHTPYVPKTVAVLDCVPGADWREPTFDEQVRVRAVVRRMQPGRRALHRRNRPGAGGRMSTSGAYSASSDQPGAEIPTPKTPVEDPTPADHGPWCMALIGGTCNCWVTP